MIIEGGKFNLDNMEEINLDGNYEIKSIKNEEELDLESYDLWNIRNQAIYLTGNVLFKTDTEDIENLIKIFIRYTHNPCNDLPLDLSIKAEKVMMGGTICPTRKVLFVYKSKVFVAYGRYIYGYDKRFVIIKRGSANISIDSNSDEDYEEEKEHIINSDEITLYAPNWDEMNTNEYVYSFMIYDKESEVVDAFGLYR